MTSMSLKDCIHAVRQGFIQFIDEVIRNSKESSLACLPEFIKILWFRLPCFLFHPTPDMLNDVYVAYSMVVYLRAARESLLRALLELAGAA